MVFKLKMWYGFQVEDIQDQAPVFLNAPYSTTVMEGTEQVVITLLSISFLSSCRSCCSHSWAAIAAAAAVLTAGLPLLPQLLFS
jgi:hypothetical protein